MKIYKLKEFSVETEDKEVMHVHIDGDPIPTQYKLEIKTNTLSLHILLPNFILRLPQFKIRTQIHFTYNFIVGLFFRCSRFANFSFK